MYSKEQSYLLTSYAPDDVQNSILQIRSKLGILPYVGGTEPDDVVTKNHAHITIKSAFSLIEGATVESLVNKLETLPLTPIPVKATSYSIYETKELGNIIVLDIEQNSLLTKLHMDIQILFEGSIENANPQFIYEKEAYTPHLSVIYNLPEEKKEKAIELVKELLPLSYTIDSMLFLGNNPGIRHTRKFIKEFKAQ